VVEKGWSEFHDNSILLPTWTVALDPTHGFGHGDSKAAEGPLTLSDFGKR
jgi:hypothetical protein